MTFPGSVPVPDPVTVMLVAHVAVNETFALVAVVGVIVYFKLPHPLAGVVAVTDCQVPANASIDVVVVVVGPVGVLEDFLLMRSHPAASTHVTTNAAARQDFMIVLIVTYDAFLYLCHLKACIPLSPRHLRMRGTSIPTASDTSSTSSLIKAPTVSPRSA